MNVSILFITYQHERYIRKAIRSALTQSYRDFELVVCDDASKDQTVSIIEEEIKECCRTDIDIIRIYAKKNQGLIGNINSGLKACNGDIIIVMSGDDISLPHRTSKLVNEFEKNPKCQLISSNCSSIDDDDSIISDAHFNQETASYHLFDKQQKIYTNSPILGATVAFRRELYEHFGPLERFAYAEDTCFWFRAALLGPIHFLSDILAQYRIHTENYTYRPQENTIEIELKRHSIHYLKYEKMMGQHLKDLSTALAAGWISPREASTIKRSIILKKESFRLNRYSLHSYPWKLWTTCAFNYFKANPSFKLFFKIYKSKLKLRLSSSKKQKYITRITRVR